MFQHTRKWNSAHRRNEDETATTSQQTRETLRTRLKPKQPPQKTPTASRTIHGILRMFSGVLFDSPKNTNYRFTFQERCKSNQNKRALDSLSAVGSNLTAQLGRPRQPRHRGRSTRRVAGRRASSCRKPPPGPRQILPPTTPLLLSLIHISEPTRPY